MACTLEPWEVLHEERAANKNKFGRELDDAALVEEIACSACRVLEKHGLMGKSKEVPAIVKKWWRLHKAKDAKKRSS